MSLFESRLEPTRLPAGILAELTLIRCGPVFGEQVDCDQFSDVSAIARTGFNALGGTERDSDSVGCNRDRENEIKNKDCPDGWFLIEDLINNGYIRGTARCARVEPRGVDPNLLNAPDQRRRAAPTAAFGRSTAAVVFGGSYPRAWLECGPVGSLNNSRIGSWFVILAPFRPPNVCAERRAAVCASALAIR
jgi:hypothetical protein